MMAADVSIADESSPLAIICGGGSLPFAVADLVLARGRPVFLVAIVPWADAHAVRHYSHEWMILGRFGRMLAQMRAAGCRDVVCIGSVLRPSPRMLRLDWETLRMLPELVRLFRGGDDHLLSGVARMFEQRGFRLVGAHEVAPDILIRPGVLTARAPTQPERDVAAMGFALLDAIGAFDVGQAAVMADRRVLAVEAAEGTDAMLARIAQLRRSGRIQLPDGAGVLVKAAKPAQDRRMDLPAIGPGTIENARAAGLAGIALRAGEVIVAEPAEVVAAADRAGLFVVALDGTDVGGRGA